MSKTKTTLGVAVATCLFTMWMGFGMGFAQAQTIADIVQAQRAKQIADYQKANAPAVDPKELIKATSKPIYTPEVPKYYLHALIGKSMGANAPLTVYAEIVYGQQLISPVTTGMTVGPVKVVAITADNLSVEVPGACKKGKSCANEAKTVRVGQALN
jgi:hypothetical protein